MSSDLKEEKSIKNKKDNCDNFLVDTSKMRWQCNPNIFKFKTTEEVKKLDTIVGQPRAIEAIRLGAQLFTKGYNIFVSGLSGTGRLSTVKRILEEVTTVCPIIYDYCYVNNFTNPDNPRLLKLSRGKGKEFAKSVSDSIAILRTSLPKIFEEEAFQTRRQNIIEEFQIREKKLLHEFDEKIKPYGFVRGQIESETGVIGPEVFPFIDSKAVQIDSIDQYVESGKITSEEAEKFREFYGKFHNELFDIARVGMKIMQEFRNRMVEHDKQTAKGEVDNVWLSVLEHYDTEKVRIFIDEIKNFILENLTLFVSTGTSLQPAPTNESEMNEAERFRQFEVNVILDNSTLENSPIIMETTPTYSNLFGTIERSYDNRGFWRTDFTRIKAGSILKADQGYLIVNALDLFNEQGVWTTLKRVLLYDKLEIQPYETAMQFSQLHLKPEPIDVKIKVIIIGGASLYKMLFTYEKGFKKIFKINAQFDSETECNEEIIQNYARFIAKICKNDGLSHCTPDGVSAIIEWAVENSGSQKRITLKFSDVADLLRESAFYSRNSDNKHIGRSEVMKAIQQRRHRMDLLDEKLKDYILDGTMLIDTEGSRVGQINGLTVLNNGFLSFGKPARITTSIAAGNAGIINIEREAEMSGAIHNKGVMIISGFFRDIFAQKKPLTLTASIAFEQSYSGIDGDSASAAEIYTLLSSLSEIPIKQNYAVTGSVNQKGDIQPIGGINEKIRGFWEICQSRGFTGDQGVIMPSQNINDLMLPQEIIDSINLKQFKIHAISRIEDGIEILMDVPAGKRLESGKFEAGSIYYLVEKRLDLLRKNVRNESKPRNNNEDKKKNKKKNKN